MSQNLAPAGTPRVESVAEVSELLATLDVMADQYVSEQRPRNTTTAYEADWRVWQRYTAGLGIPETSVSSGLLVGFVAYLEKQGAAPTTIDRRLAGAAVNLRQRGVTVDREATKKAREALKGYERRLAESGEQRGRGKAPALMIRHLRAISAECPDTLAGTRDRALALIAFAIAGRRSEVANLRVSDIVRTEQGMTVHVRFGKSGGRKVAVPLGTVPLGTAPQTCPVRAWESWLAASGITEGPALRRVDRHSRVLGGMSPQAVGDALTRAAERAGVEGITGHSARAGLATEARRAGHDAKTISETTGHQPNSAVLYGYMRAVDQWSDNALNGIGL